MTDAKPPFRWLDRPPPGVTVSEGTNGVLYLECPHDLPDYPAHVLDYLDAGAGAHPDRPYLMQRAADGGPWVPLTYADAAARLRRMARGLMDRGIGPDRPVMILSANSFEHALLTFAALHIGAPVAPVSPAYSLLSRDLAKLKVINDLVRPALVFAQNGARYKRALEAVAGAGTLVVCAEAVDAVDGAVDLAEVDGTPDATVEAARAAQDGDSVAKILFTSGSTGVPKGVVNTQRNLCSSQAMLARISEPIDPARPLVMLDWLPWHHTFGGNTNLHRVMRSGGTLYIDEGKPVPELFAVTIRNLREVAPTLFSTVPGAYGPLVSALEADAALRKTFFSKLSSLSYGGAPLSQDLFENMQALAVRETGLRIPFTTGHGMTETPLDTAVYWDTERGGLIGLPIPGTRMKLVPVGEKYEFRLAGPQIMPGYFKNDAANQAAFDAEGFFKTGDAVTWLDPVRPVEGLVFAGRLAEEFKLANGTWVNVGALRLQVLATLTPLVSDLLITGEKELGILAWPNEAALRALCPDGAADAPLADLFGHEAVTAALAERLAGHNAANPAASTRIARAALLAEPPSLDGGEVTDKRSINQRAALTRRAADVEALFADPPGAGIVIL